MDDLPIKPSKEYLEQAQKANERQVRQQTNFLKKSNSKCLPCYPDNIKEPPKKTPSFSKKQIYEQIKAKNESKYGKQSSLQEVHSAGLQPKPSVRKANKPTIADNKFEVAKQQVSVQTEKIRVPQKKWTAKQKYEHLLQQLMKQKQKMEEDKRELEEKKEYLEFKKQIRNVEGITVRLEESTKKTEQSGVTKQNKVNQFKQELQESKKLIEDLNRKVQTLTDNARHSKASEIQQMLESDFQYRLQSLSTLQNFSLQMINENISLRQFHHSTNNFYKQYATNFKGYVLVKEARQGAKSVREYQNGCMQVQMDRKYRLITHGDYRLTVFQNGDIKQELPGPIVMYYSKIKQLNRISYSLASQLYYFYDIEQIEMHSRTEQGITKEVRYKDGTIKHIS